MNQAAVIPAVKFSPVEFAPRDTAEFPAGSFSAGGSGPYGGPAGLSSADPEAEQLPEADYEVAKQLSKVDDDIAGCRAWGHDWPSRRLMRRRRGGGLPKGFRPRLLGDGCVEVTETCPDCGEERVSVTRPGGVIDRDVVRTYRYPENWERFPQGTVTPRDFQVETYRRSAEDIMAEARRNPAAEE